jgi:hypothetical protein
VRCGWLLALVMVTATGCAGADFGFRTNADPPKPPDDETATTVPAPEADWTWAPRSPGDLSVQSPSTAEAERRIRARCPDGYVVTDVDSAASNVCDGPARLFQHAADTPRCEPHEDAEVRFRCAAGDAG